MLINYSEAAKRIVRYLKNDTDKGTIMKPKNHFLGAWADTDCCGLLNKETAVDIATTAKARTLHFVMYKRCLIVYMVSHRMDMSIKAWAALCQTIHLMTRYTYNRDNAYSSMQIIRKYFSCHVASKHA